MPEERAGEEPVIAVKDVTMQFRIAMNNVSGIKEYVIQLLKNSGFFSLSMDSMLFIIHSWTASQASS